jgi:hypothetical protein
MNSTVKNILAVIAGAIIGSSVNMAIIIGGMHIIPPPAGSDITTDAGLAAAMPFMQPINFLMPFLAHAIGTFVGAYITAVIATNHKMRFALGIGVFFLVGGMMEVVSLKGPMWFNITDLVLAYIPMAYIAGILAARRNVDIQTTL